MAHKLALGLTLMLVGCQEPKPAALPTDMSDLEKCEHTPGANAEVVGCKSALADKAAIKVDQLYAQTLDVAKKADGLNKKLRPEIVVPPGHSFVEIAQESQKSWKAYAEQQCRFDEYSGLGGSGGWTFLVECRYRLNNQRIDELQKSFEILSGKLKP